MSGHMKPVRPVDPRARVVQLRDGSYIVEIRCRTPIWRRLYWAFLARSSRYDVTDSYSCAHRFSNQAEAEEAARNALVIRDRPAGRIVAELS